MPTQSFMQHNKPKLVIVESPLRARNKQASEVHLRYARACLRDAIDRGEAPLASHLLYPQVLDDSDPIERTLGIQVGFAWARHATLTAVYFDLGLSDGMIAGIRDAEAIERDVEMRSLLGQGRDDEVLAMIEQCRRE